MVGSVLGEQKCSPHHVAHGYLHKGEWFLRMGHDIGSSDRDKTTGIGKRGLLQSRQQAPTQAGSLCVYLELCDNAFISAFVASPLPHGPVPWPMCDEGWIWFLTACW
jgi:hypothetical protein